MSATILCASADPQLVAEVENQLHGGEHGWQVRGVTTSEQALEALSGDLVDAIVAPPTMIAPDGMSLLEYTHTHFPAVARLALAAEVSGPVQVDGVGPLGQALSKPCTPGNLESAVDLVLELRGLVDSEQLRTLFGAQQSLAKPPHIYTSLVELSQDPDSTAEDVVNLVQQDVGLTAEVLRLVNSAFYAQSEAVGDLSWAVVLLGLETLKSLALAGVVFRPGAALPEGLDSSDLATRAVRASTTAQKVARRERWDHDTVSEVALAALLAEVGLLVLAPGHPEGWARLREADEQTPPVEAEKEAFGCSVAEASAYLLGLWGFPAGAVAATAVQPVDLSDADAVATATPAALCVAFAHRKALGLAEGLALARSDYFDDRRVETWLRA
jgi:HD-like signal output (HDOD) protein